MKLGQLLKTLNSKQLVAVSFCKDYCISCVYTVEHLLRNVFDSEQLLLKVAKTEVINDVLCIRVKE